MPSLYLGLGLCFSCYGTFCLSYFLRCMWLIHIVHFPDGNKSSATPEWLQYMMVSATMIGPLHAGLLLQSISCLLQLAETGDVLVRPMADPNLVSRIRTIYLHHILNPTASVFQQRSFSQLPRHSNSTMLCNKLKINVVTSFSVETRLNLTDGRHRAKTFLHHCLLSAFQIWPTPFLRYLNYPLQQAF